MASVALEGVQGMVEQGEYDLRHVNLLRKAITEKRSGTALFGGSDWQAVIPFGRGVILEESHDRLAQILSEPVFSFGWQTSVRSSTKKEIPILTRQNVSKAITMFNLPARRMNAYRKAFSKLPNVRVRYLQIFRADPQYQKHFQELYQMGMAAEGVYLDDFLALSTDFAELRIRTNIVIAAYCMGDMLTAVEYGGASIGQGQQLPAEGASNLGIVSRILNRLRRN